MEDLADFTVCLWSLAESDRETVRDVRSAAAAHASPAMVLETCQRVEVYSNGECDCSAPGRLAGRDALVHLASVASGLQSAVLGEEQVVGQVRSAAADAPPELRDKLALAIAAARDLRREAGFESDAGQLLDAALELGAVPPAGSVLILGTGHLARLVAVRAIELGFERVTLAGRRPPRGAWFHDGTFGFVPLEELSSAASVDVLVGCLGSGAEAVQLGQAPAVRSLVVDLGTPRNFTGSGAVRVVSIGDVLAGQAEALSERRGALAMQLEAILDRRLTAAASTASSPLGAFRASMERIRAGELDRTRRLHPDLPAESLDAITRSLVNRIFHSATDRLAAVEDPRLRRELVALFADDALGGEA